MLSHQQVFGTQLTTPHKRYCTRNQGSNTTSFERLDFSNHNLTQERNDSLAANLKRCSVHETNLMIIEANPNLAPNPVQKEEGKARGRSISNPLPKLSHKSRDSFSRSESISSVSLSNTGKSTTNNNEACPSSFLAIPAISITTTTTTGTTQQTVLLVASNNNNNNLLSMKGNNILTRLLRKSKESKKNHPQTKSPSNQELTTIDCVQEIPPNKKKHFSTTTISFGASEAPSHTTTNHSCLSSISCYSMESNVIPFNELNSSRSELSFKDSSFHINNSSLLDTTHVENQHMTTDKGTMREASSFTNQEGDKNTQRLDEKMEVANNGEKMTANTTCQIDPTTFIGMADQEETAPSPFNNPPNLKFIRRLSSTLSQLSSQKPKRQKIRNCTNLSDCPQEIILHIASFILCTTSHTASLFAEFSLSPSGNNMIGSFSPSSITPTDLSNSTISRRNSSSIMRRIGHYPKYTSFPAELTRDYFNLMLISHSFHSALEFDPDNQDQFKNSIVEGFWKYMILWQYLYPNFSTIDKLEEYMRDMECRKSLNISYKRLYSYVNTQSLQQNVVIPKKKNVVYDPSNYFYLLVAGVNFLVVQTIRALFFESKTDFECKSIKFNKEEFKVKVESCSFMDYSLAPNSAEYKFRGTDGVIFVAYMSSRSSLDAMIKYIEKCIEFRKKDEQRTTMDPPAAIILGTITKNTTLHEISLNDLLEVKKTYSYFIKDVVIVNTDTLENIQSSFEKISAMMYRSRVKSYVKTLPIIQEALKKDDATLSQELKRRKSKLQIPRQNKKCTIM